MKYAAVVFFLAGCASSGISASDLDEPQTDALFSGDSPRAKFMAALEQLVRHVDRSSGVAASADVDALNGALLDGKSDPIGAAAAQAIVDVIAFDRQLQTHEIPLLRDGANVLSAQTASVQALLQLVALIEVREDVARPATLQLQLDLNGVMDATSFPALASLGFSDPLPAEALLAVDPTRLAIQSVSADGVALSADAWRITNGRLAVRAPGSTKLDFAYAVTPLFINADEDWSNATGLVVDRRDPTDVQVTSHLAYYQEGQLYPGDPDPSHALVAHVNITGPASFVFTGTETQRAIPGYAVAVAGSNSVTVIDGISTAGGVRLSFLVDKIHPLKTDDEYRVMLRDAAVVIDEAARILQAPYPDEQIRYIQAAGIGTGMEHQGQPNINVALLASEEFLYKHGITSTLGHEAIHGYFGNGVRIAGWENFTVSEGFTTYLERRGREKVYAHDERVHDLRYERAGLAFAMARTRTPWLVTSAFVDPQQGYSSVPYYLGAGLLRLIEIQLGREVFDPLLAAFYQAQVGKPTSIAQWAQFLTDRTGFDFVGFYAAWCLMETLPTYQANVRVSGSEVSLDPWGLSSAPPFAGTFKLPVRVVGFNGETADLVYDWINDTGPLQAGFAVAHVYLDPEVTQLVLFVGGDEP